MYGDDDEFFRCKCVWDSKTRPCPVSLSSLIFIERWSWEKVWRWFCVDLYGFMWMDVFFCFV